MLDERTEEQLKTHTYLVTATDRFLASWARSRDGLRKCAWACTADTVDAVYRWVKSRPDMGYVKIRCPGAPAWRPRCSDVSTYVVGDGHPMLRSYIVVSTV